MSLFFPLLSKTIKPKHHYLSQNPLVGGDKGGLPSKFKALSSSPSTKTLWGSWMQLNIEHLPSMREALCLIPKILWD
jgi:hypothetical protein